MTHTLAALHDFGRRQVSGALARLTESELKILREGLVIYAKALKAGRDAEAELAEPVI
jgi:hypothetical protein